jgi:hypothetical protein
MRLLTREQIQALKERNLFKEPPPLNMVNNHNDFRNKIQDKKFFKQPNNM